MIAAMRGFASALAACGLLLATTLHAAPCWTPEATDAARVQELETMLMTVSLRCRATGQDLGEAFTHFRILHSQHLAKVLARLGEHFGADKSVAGKRALDHFLIQLANQFGLGQTDHNTCRTFDALIRELAGSGATADMLETFALTMIREPHIDGPRCPPK